MFKFLKKNNKWAPPEEVESPTFCSASKRSVQLSYEGSNLFSGCFNIHLEEEIVKEGTSLCIVIQQ